MKYVKVDDLQAYCDNQIDHSITPNDFQRMNHIEIPEDIGEFSDGYHTFNALYHQRAILWATIVNQNKERAWKTRKHEDGQPCFGGGWFLVTVDTPEGPYGYHYEDKYWDMFDCKELEIAKPWDGYTEEDVHRLFSLEKHGVCEVEQIVRCKDCKRATDYSDEFAERSYHCRKNGGFHNGDWFCADGVKKDD